MDKQEAIEQIKQKTYYHCGEKECYKDGCKKYAESDIAIDIINQIDEPQKVVIPKFAAKWIEWCRKESLTLSEMLSAKENVLDELQTAVSEWMTDTNEEILARAWLDGYEIEKEKLYRIPLKGLITTDGHQQYLTGKVGRYFASRRNYHLKQTFTQTELDNNVPACYREWAEPVEEE